MGCEAFLFECSLGKEPTDASPMDVVLLHNAKAGDESWSRNDLIKLVRRAGFEPRYFTLRRALDDPRLLERGEFVIVAGGDGAICKVALAMIGRDRPIAPLPLGDKPLYDRHLAQARAALDRLAFDAAWAEGRAMTLDEAVEYALGDT